SSVASANCWMRSWESSNQSVTASSLPTKLNNACGAGNTSGSDICAWCYALGIEKQANGLAWRPAHLALYRSPSEAIALSVKDPPRDIATGGNCVHWFIGAEIAQRGHGVPQRRALRTRSDHVARGAGQLIHGIPQEYRADLAGVRLPSDTREFAMPEQAGFHGEDLHHHVGDAHHDFLLFRQRCSELARRDPNRQQGELLCIAHQPRFFVGLTTALLSGTFPQRFFHPLKERYVPLGGALKQHSRDDQPVDFACAFKNAIDASVAIVALHYIILVVSVAAVDLHPFIRDVVEHLRSVDLNDGALRRVLFNRLHFLLRGVRLSVRASLQPALDESHNAPHHGLGRVNANRHFRKLVLDGAKFSDHGSKSLALLGILRADGKHILGCARQTGTDLETPDVEDVEGNDVAAPDFS